MKIKTINIIDKVKMLNDPRILGLIAFGVVALLITWSAVGVIQTNYELDKRISLARQKVEIGRLENQNLKLKNTYYGTNQFLELSSRRQFGKAQPGEKLYIVPKAVAMKKTVEPQVISKTTGEEIDQTLPKYRQNLKAWGDFLSN